MYFDKDVISIEPTSPALGRAAFLLERVCAPRCDPPAYCAEAAQLLAMLETARRDSEGREAMSGGTRPNPINEVMTK